MNNDIKLKPCPFCGGEAIIDGCDETLWIVICKECNASIGYKETEQEAIDAWNRCVQPSFTFRELYAIYEVFTAPNPSRFLTDGYHSIVEKCDAALKGGER